MRTDYILAHEQGHFDITELYARALHKALSEYSFNYKTYQKDISAIYQNIVKEKEAFQEAYDSETDHSRRKKAQFEWQDKIDQLLTESEPYETYP
jgi:predicted secreted Zn-dependent protease